jgi:hypothetical protein
MDGSKETGVWEAARNGLGAEEEKLDRALVTGLMLELILETAASPVDPKTRRRLVKTRLKDTLVNHLAGRVTLNHFHHLLRQLDHWFPLYYPLITAEFSETPAPAAAPGRSALTPAAPAPSFSRSLRMERLRGWLDEKGEDLLPRRPHRKLNVVKLWGFLVGTQGGWFRLKDFEQHFRVDRKTAWEYLCKFRRAGLLRHNLGHSAAVRYALESIFLAVRAEALGIRVREALADLPPDLADQVSEGLILAGGEAFWEEDRHYLPETSLRQEVISCLQAEGVLEKVCQVGGTRMLQITRRWLWD